MHRPNLKGYLVVLVLVPGMVGTVAGSIITVDVNGFADYNNIQEAIDNASNSDVVVVNPGTYTGDGNRDIEFLGKAITVRSIAPTDPYIVAATVIDCNGTPAEPHRGFYFHENEDGISVLNGFTIINGYTSRLNSGGAIYCYDSSPTIANCLFSDNSAEVHGGGVSNWESSPTLIKCTFSGNSALYGGGMVNWDNSSPVVTNCTFRGNSAWLHNGGGMYNRYSSSPKLTNCMFSGNTAWGSGGGMRNSWGSKPELTNCVFSGNSSVHDGGGICNYDSAPSIANCIFWANTDESGSGESAQIYDFSSTSIMNYCCVQGWTGQLGGIGNIDVAPCFVEPGKWVDANDPNIGVEPNDPNAMWVDGDYRLRPDSPCIDAGDNNSVPADTADLDGDGNTTEPIPWDIDGNARIVDGNNDGNAVVDMGAYEYFVPPIEVAMKFTPQALNPGSKGKWVKAHFVLPEEYSVEDVDTDKPAVIEPGNIESDHMNVFVNDDGMVEIEAVFERGVFCEASISDEAIEVTVMGAFMSGQQFYGTDIIKVTTSYFKHLGVLASYWLEQECDKPDWCEGADLDQDSAVDFVDLALYDGCCIEVVGE